MTEVNKTFYDKFFFLLQHATVLNVRKDINEHERNNKTQYYVVVPMNYFIVLYKKQTNKNAFQ